MEVTGTIDTETPIDYPRLYAQLMHELSEGQPFHFFPYEEAAIQEHNRDYQQHGSAEEVLTSFFEPAKRSVHHFMKAIDIQEYLESKLRADDVPNIKKLTVALKQCGFQYGRIQGQRGWYAKKIERR